MKAGQYYERLKLAEYVAAFLSYDEKKCEAATQRATYNQRKEGQQRAEVITGNLADLIQFEEGEQPLYTNAWLKGQRPRLTHAQRQELAERDKTRKQWTHNLTRAIRCGLKIGPACFGLVRVWTWANVTFITFVK